MLENYLIPIAKKHSINRVIASIFIPQSFVKPADVFENNKGKFHKYQKKSLINTTTINLNNNSIGISQESEPKGFIFEEYGKDGVVNNIFKLENNREAKSLISFENRNYMGWTNFIKRFLKDVKVLASNNNFYVEAVSLTYVDEFIWNSKDNIDIESIFNDGSELLNQKFLNSTNGTLILISQGKGVDNNFEEKTEISFSNDLKRIVLNHQYAIKLSDLKMFTDLDKEVEKLFNYAHEENKKVLKDLLTNECQKLIKLK